MKRSLAGVVSLVLLVPCSVVLSQAVNVPMHVIENTRYLSGNWVADVELDGEARQLHMTVTPMDGDIGYTIEWVGPGGPGKPDTKITAVGGWDSGNQVYREMGFATNGDLLHFEYKQLSDSSFEGKGSGIYLGQKLTETISVERTSRDRFVWKAMNMRVGDKPLSDQTYSFRRVSDAAIPDKAMASLKYLVGSWEGETYLNGKSIGNDNDNRKWLTGKHAILMESDGSENGKRVYGSGICGWDAKGRQLTETWYTSEGLAVIVRYPLEDVKDDAWSGNFTVTYSDGRSSEGGCVLMKTDAGFEWTAKWVEDGERMVRKSVVHRIK